MIAHRPVARCSAGEVQDRVRVLQERLRTVEGELEEGQEERSAKYAELRVKEQKTTGESPGKA